MSWGLTGVTVRYGAGAGAVTALDDVTLEAPEGAVVGVVGGDGAGKTTLLRALVREVVPTTGSVRAPRAVEIGYLPASSGSWADLSVQENLEFVGRSFGIGRAALAGRGGELLARAGLDHVRGRLARQLSGGMRRKLGFCLAMVAEPRLLVLDEPSTGVDPVSRVDLWRLVSQAAAAGTAVVMSTTYLDEAERCATLLMLDEGHTVAVGTPADALAAMPGVVTATTTPVHPARAWRRGREHHEWWPPGETPAGGRPVPPDLEDVAIVATLARRGAAA